MKPETQKAQTGQNWVQEDGNTVEKGRLFPFESKAERSAVKLFNMSIKIQGMLRDFVQEAEAHTEMVREAYLKVKAPEKLEEDHKLKGYTFYSFNRDIKVEKVVQPLTGYREEDIALSKEHFEKYIDDIEDPGSEMIVLKELVMSAFTTKSGKFDYKKLDALLSYKDKIENETFQKAVALLGEAKYFKKVKSYYNVYFRNEEDVYEQVNLRLSGVN